MLVIEGKDRQEVEAEKRQQWETRSLEEHMAFYEEQGIPRKEAMKFVAKDRGITKRDVYQSLLQSE